MPGEANPAPVRGLNIRASACCLGAKDPVLEILKTDRAGINTALKRPCSRGNRGPQSNETKEKSNNMLNKINKRRGGFTLVEIMIVVAIIALLAAIAVPGFLRARKRSQASRILNDLRLIDSAVDQYAIETNKASGAAVAMTDWTNYLKKGSVLYNTGADLFSQRTALRRWTRFRASRPAPRQLCRT